MGWGWASVARRLQRWNLAQAEQNPGLNCAGWADSSAGPRKLQKASTRSGVSLTCWEAWKWRPGVWYWHWSVRSSSETGRATTSKRCVACTSPSLISCPALSSAAWDTARRLGSGAKHVRAGSHLPAPDCEAWPGATVCYSSRESEKHVQRKKYYACTLHTYFLSSSKRVCLLKVSCVAFKANSSKLRETAWSWFYIPEITIGCKFS